MIENFPLIMPEIFTLEGGFSNDPRDTGGITNLGVTARAWAAWIKQPLSSITAAMMQNLTQDAVMPFYRANYWNLIDGDALPAGVDAMVLHFEINAGGVAARELQGIVGIVGASQDGVIGQHTLAAVGTYIRYSGLPRLIRALADAQTTYYESLPRFADFGEGWLRRVSAVQALANNLATRQSALVA